MLEDIKNAIEKIKGNKPLILILTNYVTMDFIANSLLAIGAAPIMSEYESDLEDLVKISNAIYINIGSLHKNFINSAKLATKLAKKYNKPLILDPVGSGATSLRNELSKKITVKADIVRGNASEIISLIDDGVRARGVESLHSTHQAKEIAQIIAKVNNNVVTVSGEVDFITNGDKDIELRFGSSLMPLITGMGCSLTAIIATFKTIIPDSFEASKLATAYFGLCGQITESKTDKPGSFRVEFINQLYSCDIDTMRKFI
jgi:hydroxyethylthiazole kinase